MTLKPNEVINIPLKFKLEYNVPITTRRLPVYISTNLGIESAIDNVDRDYIEVVLNDNMEIIINYIKQLGFSLKTVECEYVNSNRCFQEFEFEPRYNSEFRGGFLEDIFGLDESQLRFSFTNDDLINREYVKNETYNI